MKQIKMEILSNAINKYMEVSDSNKDAVFEKEEIEQLIKSISIDSEYFLVAPYIKLLLLDNYELLQKLKNKNNQFYKDPDGKFSSLDLKEFVDILENIIADKVQFKEDTTLIKIEDKKFDELKYIILQSILYLLQKNQK